jgi:acyl dehydratase
MKIIENLAELKAFVGQKIGISEWVLIDQDKINAFAELTGDKQWIHTNPMMAKMSPLGSTVAHGFFVLSLYPQLMYKLWEIKGVKMAVNYGLNKLRFPAPVPVDSLVRMEAVLDKVEETDKGIQLTITATFEIEGKDKPACVAETISRIFL